MGINRSGTTLRTLLWASAGLVIVAAVIGSPAAAVAVAVLAALCAIAPVVGGPMRVRVVALIVLVASIALAITTFPGAQREMGAYRERATKARPAQAGVPTRSP